MHSFRVIYFFAFFCLRLKKGVEIILQINETYKKLLNEIKLLTVKEITECNNNNLSEILMKSERQKYSISMLILMSMKTVFNHKKPQSKLHRSDLSKTT